MLAGRREGGRAALASLTQALGVPRAAGVLALSVGALALGCTPLPPTWTEPRSGIRVVLVPAGKFQMGSPEHEVGREPQEVLHRVEITRPFYIGATEVTQSQWRAIMGSSPSWFASCGPNCPVERVSWNDVQAFLAALERSSGRPFRLPTETEWEYSCRAGSTTPFHTGDGLSTDQANYDGEGTYDGASSGVVGRSTIAVAAFEPNAFGLYDMHGNVWEWTEDWHCPYPAVGVSDPLGSCPSELKVIRGGSWYFGADSARCALRYTHRPQDSGFSIGFRVALPADAMGPRWKSPGGSQRQGESAR